MRKSWRREWRARCRDRMIGLALLVVSCAVVGCATTGSRPPCVEQSTEALREIASGQLEAFNPAVAAWERDQARACGWIEPEDFKDALPELNINDVDSGADPD